MKEYKKLVIKIRMYGNDVITSSLFEMQNEKDDVIEDFFD